MAEVLRPPCFTFTSLYACRCSTVKDTDAQRIKRLRQLIKEGLDSGRGTPDTERDWPELAAITSGESIADELSDQALPQKAAARLAEKARAIEIDIDDL